MRGYNSSAHINKSAKKRNCGENERKIPQKSIRFSINLDDREKCVGIHTVQWNCRFQTGRISKSLFFRKPKYCSNQNYSAEKNLAVVDCKNTVTGSLVL